MKLEIEYWDNKRETVTTETGFCYLKTESVLSRVEEWEGTEEEIYLRYDKANNKLRYCNGSNYKFKDGTYDERYMKWYKRLDESTKLNLFYGNGTVD